MSIGASSKRGSHASLASLLRSDVSRRGVGPAVAGQSDAHEDGSSSPVHSEDDDASDVSSAESAFSLPGVEIRVGGYLQLVGEAAGAADRLDAAVGSVLALKRSLNASSAVPPNVSRRLTVVTSVLYRSASESCFAVTELSRLVVRFTRGLIVSEVSHIDARRRIFALLQCLHDSASRSCKHTMEYRRSSAGSRLRLIVGAQSVTQPVCARWRQSESTG